MMYADTSLARNITAVRTFLWRTGAARKDPLVDQPLYVALWVVWVVISVWNNPGAMAFTLMPRRAVHCCARSRVRPSRPALLAE